ncbi:SRPBCC family protein [Streptomyces sporangiiformans]|uniref:SRPBCC family protein n=1 Tax=Streptomyces sporangiiformans TaxID=2315329 RepID=A0A505CWL7_9ACTN|nr:SRPBCC family protein [Streptomyces sporangiiformans]TPQ16453.1 SRPBCC family protein [Streptomyces sporangiiformans]
MLTVEVTETFPCTPDELLDFVMDVERYALVDRKLRPVLWTRRDGNLLEFAFRPRLAGLPAPRTVARARLTPGHRIDIALAPPPANRLTRLASDFDARFVCTPVENGTRLVRTLNFRFRPPLRWLAEPLLRRPLTADVQEEVRLAKEYIQRQKEKS